MGDCGDCCGERAVAASSAPKYVRALWLVTVMNGAMFLAGLVALSLSGSVAVRADMLDFLGDAVSTGAALLLIDRSKRTRNNASLVQGAVLGVLGVYAFAGALYRFTVDVVPQASEMGVYGVMGFGVNLGAALLLLRHRHGDTNVRAVWLYSRNDALGNVGVVLAALAVSATGSKIPDVIVGIVISALFSHSAYEIVRAAVQERAKIASA